MKKQIVCMTMSLCMLMNTTIPVLSFNELQSDFIPLMEQEPHLIEPNPEKHMSTLNEEMEETIRQTRDLNDYKDFNDEHDALNDWIAEQFDDWSLLIDDQTRESMSHILNARDEITIVSNPDDHPVDPDDWDPVNPNFIQNKRSLNSLLRLIRTNSQLIAIPGLGGLDYSIYQSDIENIDEAFRLEETKINQNIIFYAKTTAEDFGADPDDIYNPDGTYDADNLDDLINNFFLQTEAAFGIDHGYPVGNFIREEMIDKEIVLFKIKVEKGTPMIKISDHTFALKRNTTFYFESIELNGEGDNRYIEINVSLVPPEPNYIEELKETALAEITSYIDANYPDFNKVGIEANGLYAGRTYNVAGDIIKTAFDLLGEDNTRYFSSFGSDIIITDGAAQDGNNLRHYEFNFFTTSGITEPGSSNPMHTISTLPHGNQF